MEHFAERGGDINVDYTNTLSFVMAGNRIELMNFIEEYAGRGFIVIYQECGTGVRYIIGSLCKPMDLKSFDRKDDNEGRYITLILKINTGSNRSSIPVTL